jgi:cytosine/adenosine deaminase-related metal-dependent hydrolase
MARLAAHAQKEPVALTGTLATPTEVVENGAVLIRDGRIVAVGAGVPLPPGTKVVATGGVIAPGLIDLHNHLTWNIFPRWKPSQEFGNRYDWQQKPAYNVLMTVPHQALVDAGLECEMERYAEVKAIAEGETSVTGSPQLACDRGLARNLDYDPELGGSQPGKIVYNVFPLQMSEPELAAAKAALDGPPRGALLIHLAEGSPRDAAAAREFAMLKGRGLLRPGVSLIHAGGVKPEGFAEMAKAGVGFVWSPRSNIELYGDTANVAAARAAGVVTALAPDWSPTGSDGLLGELNYASVWNHTQSPPPFAERDLVRMATANAAELVGLEDKIGSLAPGYAADLIVLRSGPSGPGKDAYWTITHSTPADLRLVVIGGEAVYGDPALLKQAAAPGASPEPIDVCGAAKAVVLPGGGSFAQTESTLDLALRRFGRQLAPLAECGQ